MAIRRINESPRISDQIIFDILCPGADDCFTANPYKVDSVTIYYIERDFTDTNFGEYTQPDDPALEQKLEAAKQAACLDPSEVNLLTVQNLQEQLSLSDLSNTFYYKDAKIVEQIGTDDTPAWLDPTQVPPEDVEEVTQTNRLLLIDEDEDGNSQYGRFEFQWTPLGMREGDYFVCWTWTPNPGGDSITAHEHFNLFGNTQITTSIPSHFTIPGKYETLLDRYLPQMFKDFICSGDLTPYVMQELNKSVAKGFTFLEDLANQIPDLIDANTAHEQFIPYLSALFNLKLRSADPTLWRRQTKRAMALFKKKGTLDGLTEALLVAGIKLNKFTRLWQVVSHHSWQECFVASEENGGVFQLSKVADLTANEHLKVYHRSAEEDSDWVELTPDYIQLANTTVNLPAGCSETGRTVTIATWVGDQLSVDPVILYAGDSVRILYQFDHATGVGAAEAEAYLTSLPLADQRDERDQDYPLKNWNVRLIEETDPFFDIIIPTRHPYYDPIFWGWIRTEFPYSENIYNMEEYNGSTRQSLNPCDIDKNFLDNCHGGQASKFNIDLEIENLSNERISEAQEIIKEYVPFHSMLHSMLITGGVNEYITCSDHPELLGRIRKEDVVISGGQHIFNRIMQQSQQITRDELASMVEASNLLTGTLENAECILYTPEERLEGIGLDINNVLKVQQPWVGDDTYKLTYPNQKTAVVTDGIPPVTDDSFAFKLYNQRYTNNNANIYQEYLFSDENVDFQQLWDTTNPDISYDGSWKLVIAAYPSDDGDEYTIKELGDNLVIDYFEHTGCTLPLITTSDISYTLVDAEDNVLASSTKGVWDKGTRGVVDVSSETGLTNIRNYAAIDDYISYDSINYKISGFLEGETHKLYISQYTDGTAVGVTISVLKQLLSSVGYFQYRGLALTTTFNFETSFGITNGVNGDLNTATDASERFKENYLILIGESYYTISEVDGSRVSLVGPPLDIGFTPESTEFQVFKFIKEQGDIVIPERSNWYWPGGTFSVLDRRGNDAIEAETSGGVLSSHAFAKAANMSKKPIEITSQQESITVKIDYIEEKK